MAEPAKFLVVLETAGNQAFIFDTNKRRENVGGSELVWRAGVQFPLQAVAEAGGPDLFSEDPETQRNKLLKNPSQGGIEVVLAVSGKAILMVDHHDVAKQLVQRVTHNALKHALGVDVRGAIVEFDPTQKSYQQAQREAHDKLAQLRAFVPGPEARFLRLPVVADCASSGLPAAVWSKRVAKTENDKLRSAVSEGKLGAVWLDKSDRVGRMEHVVKRLAPDVKLPRGEDLDQLDDLDWLAVVHADANGMGRVFSALHDTTEVRRFSVALDRCTEAAFGRAIDAIRKLPNKLPFLPLVPLVLGGDDLTVLLDGKLAIPFTVEFLKAFEQVTGSNRVVRETLEKHGHSFASSCAGVAIVKPHFPFHAAYELVEELTRNAKNKVKDQVPNRPCSAFDWHVLYDASSSQLATIRQRMTSDGGATIATARPYVVTEGDRTAHDWAKNRHVDRLREQAAAVKAPDKDDSSRRALPNSMLHELREGLFEGKNEAEARLNLVRERYSELRQLTVEGRLFWDDVAREREPRNVTGLWDAMELAEFWPTEGKS